MTDIQQRILRYIAIFLDMHKRSPTYREIAQGMGGMGVGNVHRIVGLLVADGYLTHAPARACSIQLTAKALQGDCRLIPVDATRWIELEAAAAREGSSPISIAHKAIAAYLGRAA